MGEVDSLRSSCRAVKIAFQAAVIEETCEVVAHVEESRYYVHVASHRDKSWKIADVDNPEQKS